MFQSHPTQGHLWFLYSLHFPTYQGAAPSPITGHFGRLSVIQSVPPSTWWVLTQAREARQTPHCDFQSSVVVTLYRDFCLASHSKWFSISMVQLTIFRLYNGVKATCLTILFSLSVQYSLNYMDRQNRFMLMTVPAVAMSSHARPSGDGPQARCNKYTFYLPNFLITIHL
jgi:hypothetical protein